MGRIDYERFMGRTPNLPPQEVTGRLGIRGPIQRRILPLTEAGVNLRIDLVTNHLLQTVPQVIDPAMRDGVLADATRILSNLKDKIAPAGPQLVAARLLDTLVRSRDPDVVEAVPDLINTAVTVGTVYPDALRRDFLRAAFQVELAKDFRKVNAMLLVGQQIEQWLDAATIADAAGAFTHVLNKYSEHPEYSEVLKQFEQFRRSLVFDDQEEVVETRPSLEQQYQRIRDLLNSGYTRSDVAKMAQALNLKPATVKLYLRNMDKQIIAAINSPEDLIEAVKNAGDQERMSKITKETAEKLQFDPTALRDALVAEIIRSRTEGTSSTRVETLIAAAQTLILYLPLNQTTLNRIMSAFDESIKALGNPQPPEITTKFDQLQDAIIEAIILDFDTKVPLAPQSTNPDTPAKRLEILRLRLKGVSFRNTARQVNLNPRRITDHVKIMRNTGYLEGGDPEALAGFEETLRIKDETTSKLREDLERADELKLSQHQKKILELLITVGDHKNIIEILGCSPDALRSVLYDLRRKGVRIPKGPSRYS